MPRYPNLFQKNSHEGGTVYISLIDSILIPDDVTLPCTIKMVNGSTVEFSDSSGWLRDLMGEVAG
jgi:hypothetical protein